MESVKKKEIDMSEKKCVSKQKVKGDVKDKKAFETSKKNGCCRKTKNGKSKKTADSASKKPSSNQRETRSSSDQAKTESKSTKAALAKQMKQPAVREKQNIKPSTKVKGPPVKKEEIKLRPSDIRYSQSSISNQFTDGTDIGQLLDDIYFGRCFASAIPQIEVSKMKEKWVSADNRRLWVFKQLEVLGKMDFITVKVSKRIYSGKLTSGNGGRNIEIRGADPSGTLFPLINGGSQNKQTAKRRRRRRRAKTNQTEKQIVISTPHEGNRLKYSEATGISVCQGDIDKESGSIQHKTNLFDDGIFNEEFAFYDSDEWTDDDVPDTCLRVDNDTFSHYLSDNSWHECEKLLKRYQVEKVIDEYSETYSSSVSNTSEYSVSYDFTTDFNDLATNRRYSDFSEKDFEHPKEEIIPFSKSLDKDRSAQAVLGMHFDDDARDQWVYYQATLDYSYGQDYHKDLCGKRECSRCSRMLFYREMDKGYYYEPPCQYIKAGHKSQYNAQNRNNGVKQHSENLSVLTEISRGLEKVVGFFNELFR